MGGFFGVASKRDSMTDVFFGVDYHSHLGTKRAGLAAYDPTIGLQRKIHNIENTPFRTKFEHIFDEMMHFFEVYKTLEHKKTTVKDILHRDEAMDIINKCLAQYEKVAKELKKKNK